MVHIRQTVVPVGTPPALAYREEQKQKPNIILKAIHTKRTQFKYNILGNCGFVFIWYIVFNITKVLQNIPKSLKTEGQNCSVCGLFNE